MPANNGRSTTTQRGAKRIYENIFDRYTDKKYMYIYLYKYIYTHLFTSEPYMYISNITHVNITNYLKISFQSVSDSVLVQQQHVTSWNQLQQVENWSGGICQASWKQSEPKKKTKNKQTKKTVRTGRNQSELASPHLFHLA